MNVQFKEQIHMTHMIINIQIDTNYDDTTFSPLKQPFSYSNNNNDWTIIKAEKAISLFGKLPVVLLI